MAISRREAMALAVLGASIGFSSRVRAAPCCPVLELRQYTLHPGRRDVLIELFEREFIESQEALGAAIPGTFRDLDKADRFVWLRGFDNMDDRARALQAFYTGPVWKAHREAANATMIDSENVLLLRPARSSSGFVPDARTRPSIGATQARPGLVIATVYAFSSPVDAAFIDLFEDRARPILADSGGAVLASFVTESAPNNFPALPVRENENVFVWFAAFDSPDRYSAHLSRLRQSEPWQSIAAQIRRQLKSEPETLRLAPTARSLLHG